MNHLLGPHLIDCTEELGDVVLNPSFFRPLSERVQVTGRGPGSLEDDETAGLDYLVVTGSSIRDYLAPLWRGYHDLAARVSEILGLGVRCSEDVDSAVNVNILEGSGGRYELHTDSQPWTLIVFATDHSQHPRGGELLVQHPVLGDLRIPSACGMGVLFDGSRLPHGVTPMRSNSMGNLHPVRVTIPMVFVDPSKLEIRADGQSDYLYAGETPASVRGTL